MAAEYVTTGEFIQTSESGFLMGHGTMMEGARLIATVSGFVERVNKLISVRPLNTRYTGEIGDVVVGRVMEVADKRWRVDLGSRQHAVLMLSSVNLPGGVQRRRTYEDSLQMRTFFKEDDLISAEVQKLMGDGAISLHTRSLKYGKLENGQCIQVPAALIKRRKLHFHTLECQVDVILGTNGFIWITATPPKVEEEASEDKVGDDSGASASRKPAPAATADDRERICRVRNSILALARKFIAIHSSTIMDVYNDSINNGLAAKDILNPEILTLVTQTALSRSS